jgi:hypothetical protein
MYAYYKTKTQRVTDNRNSTCCQIVELYSAHLSIKATYSPLMWGALTLVLELCRRRSGSVGQHPCGAQEVRTYEGRTTTNVFKIVELFVLYRARVGIRQRGPGFSCAFGYEKATGTRSALYLNFAEVQYAYSSTINRTRTQQEKFLLVWYFRAGLVRT